MSPKRSFRAVKAVGRMPRRAMKSTDNETIALADTLSAQSITALLAIACQTHNPSLVSELRNGIGDTSVSEIDESEGENSSAMPQSEAYDAETQSIDFPAGASDKAAMPNQPLPDAEFRPTPPVGNEQPAASSAAPIKAHPAAEPQRFGPLMPPQREAISVISTAPLRKYAGAAPPIYDDIALSGAETVISAPGRKTPSKEIDVGTVVDFRYEILSKIDEGGFGMIYKARQIGLDRIVALKRLKSQNDRCAVQRFLLEANIIKNLIHPNTIQLIDAGIDDNHLFIVMEYVEGISLRELISANRAIEPLRAIGIAIQILKSLHEAHELGIIHRDVKPSNILIRNIIGERDFVKVLDFGIARAQYSSSQRITQDGKILGTPQYLAPELLYGDNPTPSADIFAVGLILAEMLTGHSLLPKTTREALMIAASKKPIPIPASLMRCELGKIIRCAININPSMRYQNAADMIKDLRHAELRLKLNDMSVSSQHRCMRRTHLSTSTIYWIAGAAMLFVITNIIMLYHFFG